MPQAHGADVKYAWKNYPLAAVDEEPPTLNQWYTVLDETGGVKLLWMIIFHNNDGGLNEDIEVRWTIDGETWTIWVFPFNLPSGTNEWIHEDIFGAATLALPLARLEGSPDPYFAIAEGTTFQSHLLEAHAMKLEVRLTSMTSTNHILRAWARYQKLEAV